MKNNSFRLAVLIVLLTVLASLIWAETASDAIRLETRLATHERISSELRTDIAHDYSVRPGDLLYIRIYSPILTLDPEEKLEPIVPVTLTGHVILYPLTSPVRVASRTLAEARDLIITEIRRHIPEAEVFIDLYQIQPHTIHVLGAVKRPGEYVTDSLVTLYQSLQLAGGLSPAASKRVSVTRRQQTKTYDLNRYLIQGDLSQNPILFGDDVVRAVFADEFAKVYVVTDTVNYVEYFEMETERQVAEILTLLSKKYPYSDYQNIYLRRDSVTRRIEPNYYIRSGDNVFLHPEESFIYVAGSVNNPGRFTYLASKSPRYYISLAGGVDRYGSAKRVLVVSEEGTRSRFRGQELKEGDSLIVPLSTRTIVNDYLTPISALVSVVATIVVLTR